MEESKYSLKWNLGLQLRKLNSVISGPDANLPEVLGLRPKLIVKIFPMHYTHNSTAPIVILKRLCKQQNADPSSYGLHRHVVSYVNGTIV